MDAIKEHRKLELQVIAAGSMVLERFDQPTALVKSDGFPVNSCVYMELEGSTPTTMAKSVGFGVVEFASELQRLSPDVVLVIGDRYEALAATLAASFMNIPVAHVQGGEVSGSIDESTRHAMSKYAQYHFPSTQQAADFLVRMGEREKTILTVGCPSSDLAAQLDRSLPLDFINESGSGTDLDPAAPYLLAVFHPTTTEFGAEGEQIEELLHGLDRVGLQTLLLWPNIDAGSDRISKAIRVFRAELRDRWLRIITNLTPDQYLLTLARASCAVGNSSSFVRDASYFGTPVVLVGNRQRGRETASNVVGVSPRRDLIAQAVTAQVEHRSYPPSDLYGDGQVSTRIATALATMPLYVQKRLGFVDE